MKKINILLILLGVLAICLPGASAAANTLKSPKTVLQQTVLSQHKIHKKRRRVRRRVAARKSARMQMQVRQGQKHLQEEHRVQKAEQQLKKDTSKSN